MSGLASSRSEETGVRGLPLRMASASTISVCKTTILILTLPRTFYKDIFVKPIRCSHYPLYQGAHFGMNHHCTPSLPSASGRHFELRSQ